MNTMSSEPEAKRSSEPPNFTDRPVIHLDDSTPNEFWEQSVELLFRTYALKDVHLKQFPAAERHDLWPQHRRALIERDWRELALNFGLASKPDLNKSLNAYHTTVSAGLVVITQSHVEDRRYLPRPADFRETLTKSSQAVLFTTPETESPSSSARVYAILTHGTDPQDPLQPGWADVIFPAIDGGETVIAHRIRLFEDRYPNLVAQFRAERQPPATAPEVVKDEANPTLRKSEEFGG